MSNRIQRQEYNDFLEDRLRTVKALRASGGDIRALDQSQDCLRGLEPFQTALEHHAMNTKQRFHQTTILLEQMRQSTLGIRDPDRYRLLVAAQSEFALRRAQELAALDEHEVYQKVCRRHSLLTTASNFSTVSSTTGTEGDSNGALKLSLSARIRRLQELNARRLYDIYKVSDTTSSSSGGIGMNENLNINSLSRFQIRRDSLYGSSTIGAVNHRQLVAPPNRFNIRRDSLGRGL